VRALVILAALGACSAPKTPQLDLDSVRVTSDARLRTDTIGGGTFTDLATFVLVDTQNTATKGAYVTLAGELDDKSGARVGWLRAQSLWIPAGETRTFALIDQDRKPRPTAAAAKIVVRGATVSAPPPIHVDSLRELTDNGRIVAQGIVTNDAERAGRAIVIASFHDAQHQPMTRPYTVLDVPPHGHQPVQFVGPPGSVHGTIFVGELTY
jgi:hypothetical protein